MTMRGSIFIELSPLNHFYMYYGNTCGQREASRAFVRSITSIFFNGSSSNFVTLFVSIISWQSLITCQIPWNTLELWPFNYQKKNNNIVRSVTWIFFNGSSSNLVYQTDNVFWHYLSTTFNNQPDLIKHFGVMALI